MMVLNGVMCVDIRAELALVLLSDYPGTLCYNLGLPLPIAAQEMEEAMSRTKPAKTISQVFEEFLSDQKARQSAKTQSKYRSIVQLFEAYLESYWPDHGQEEHQQITGAGGTFCGTFGPEAIAAGYSEFLGYFMPRKVIAGKETMKAAGTVLKKLAKWLSEKGYVKDASAARERAGEAVKDLPASQEVLDLLGAYIQEHQPVQSTEEIEDHFWIKKIEPGQVWLEPLTAGRSEIGPILVPKKVTQLCQTMWDIGGVVAKTSRGWRFIEVWNVTA
jgi:hypothetical protein